MADPAAPQPLQQPKLVSAITQLLTETGVNTTNPHILNMLVELVQRYIIELLNDSDDYRIHRSAQSIDVDDVKLALETRAAQQQSVQPPPRELLYTLAQQRNSAPLPLIPVRTGVLLPPAKYCMTQPIYGIKTEIVDDTQLNGGSQTPTTVIVNDSEPHHNDDVHMNGNATNDSAPAQSQSNGTSDEAMIDVV